MKMRRRRGKPDGAELRRRLRRCAQWVTGRSRSGAAREFDLAIALRLSLALHLAVVFAVVLWPDTSRPVRWESAPLQVSLVTLSEETRTAAPAPLATPEPRPSRPPQPTRRPPPDADAPREAVRRVPPVAETKPSAEPPAENRGAQPAPDLPAPSAAEGPVRMNVQVDEEAFVYDYYFQALIAKISQAWRPPAGLAAGEGSSATLRFRITAQGRVPQIEVETSSALELFDRSALEAVQRAQPLPPFPPAYRGRWLTVHLKFSLQE